MNKFIDNAINEQDLKIVGGTQQFAYLDIRDAASGIIALLAVPAEKWKPVYNLGYLRSYSIQEIANIVKIVGKEFNLFVKIIKETSDVSSFAELDSTLFYHDTNWQPKYNMEAMVRNIFENRLRGKIN
ncbi:MAG: NAD(P)-dependent oxidoreductase [Desulfovibrionales bacterium]|nr:NAD(P)-dependent oxidoreductase [Desulfovibrionales bacterium]